MVVFKIIGGLIFVLGLWITIGFPFFGTGAAAFQNPGTSKAGILMGVILMIVGFLMAYFM